MSKQTIALAYTQPEDALEEAQYQALVAALSANARGRAFLAEHARRSRSAETTTLLSAIARVGAQVRPQGPPREPIRAGLRTLLAELHTARAAIEANDAPPEADELNALLDRLQTRLTELLAPANARSDRGSPPPIREAAVQAAPEPPSAARWLDVPPEPAPPDNDVSPPPRPAVLDIEANPPRMPPVANLEPGTRRVRVRDRGRDQGGDRRRGRVADEKAADRERRRCPRRHHGAERGRADRAVYVI